MSQLTDVAIRQAKPEKKAYTLKDDKGLFISIEPNGAKYWLFRFSWGGKQKRISFGPYPKITLQQARGMRDGAQHMLGQGIDPREAKKQKKQQAAQHIGDTLSFNEFVQTWFEHKLKKLQSKPSKEKKNGGRQSTAVTIERYLRMDMLPILGHMKLREITRPDVYAVQKKIEKRGALSIAEKVRTWLNEIFQHAMVLGYIDTNPAAELHVVALPYRRTKHNPHLEMAEIPELMAKLHHYHGERQTVLGLRLLLLTGVRQAELRFAEPEQFDLENALWCIPAEDVKQLQRVKIEKDAKVPDYIVPLSRQAVAIIQELLSYKFMSQRYLLCHRSEPRRTVSENTLNGALRRLGFEGRLTGHGIRGTISTALNELDYDEDWIEAQLSHKGEKTNKVRAAYNHARYIEQRRKMMQDWADMLDGWEQEGLEKLTPTPP